VILSQASLGTGPSITYVHGFTQTKESWIPVVEQLAQDFSHCLLDAPGHGSSHDGQRSLQQAGDDVAESMPTGVLVGYSMGARIALHTALQHPEKVTALVLISGTAGIDNEDERSARRSSDEALAQRISDIGVESFIAEWLSNPMFSGLSTELADIPHRRINTATGLGDSLRCAGTGTQKPLWNQLGQITIPVLLIAGESDQKFVNNARRMNDLLPNSELHIMNGVGHTCHLEDISQFRNILQNWLSGLKRDN
jgi:2-succinyl-6-hydroxy-2,4-cyclohexadiene-1-carboxylate synthase